MRQAVSKKDASKIEYHKALFIGGCGKNGISASAAQAIYADIEFFARYASTRPTQPIRGLTVQTAYLKAKYPVEYMAALLLVERDKTEKVINFIQECRRMGIHVLPPDVNLQWPGFRDSGAARGHRAGYTSQGPDPGI